MIRDLIVTEARRAKMTPGEFLAERNRPLWSRALAEAAARTQPPLGPPPLAARPDDPNPDHDPGAQPCPPPSSPAAT